MVLYLDDNDDEPHTHRTLAHIYFYPQNDSLLLFRFSVIIISKTKTYIRRACIANSFAATTANTKEIICSLTKAFENYESLFFWMLYIHSRMYRKCKALQQRRPLVRVYSLCRSFIWKFGEGKRGIFAAVSASVLLHFLHIIRNDLPSHTFVGNVFSLHTIRQ